MNDEEAFQAALISNPDDRTSRLVYADWLQDRDDPRADGVRYVLLTCRGMSAGRLGDLAYCTLRRGSPNGTYNETNLRLRQNIPDPWFSAIIEPDITFADSTFKGRKNHKIFRTAQEAENALVLAWTVLTDDQKAVVRGLLRAQERP